MGHERIGYLPKTQRWINIVNRISEFSLENDDITNIATDTLKNVRSRFKNITEDSGVISAFKFLVLLINASKSENPSDFLNSYGISLPNEFDLFQLTRSAQNFIIQAVDSNEYSTFAVQSMIDTISNWSQKNQIQQKLIFDSTAESFSIWQKAANGSGFCELSRLFFSNFTKKYLKYFLEREASSRIQSLTAKEHFNKKLESHIDDISKHAFDTSKIAESFSAGWYNLHAKTTIPEDEKLKDFLAFSFKKINSEILMEEMNER